MSEPLVGYITDTEGNHDYWCRCVALSRVLEFDASGSLAFARPASKDVFVFGGDVFDRGPGDIRIATELVRLKDMHPDRVHLLAGNRDLNKLRIVAEALDERIDRPYPVPLYPRAPAQITYRSYLQATVGEGAPLEQANTVANRLRWLLDCTMTAKGAFESRRTELVILAGHAGAAAGSISDDDVAASFVDSVSQEDGFVSRYLSRSGFAALIGCTLLIHGGVPDGAGGWVPSLSMRYATPTEGDSPGGETLPESYSAVAWVEAMNEFLRKGLQDFRGKMEWHPEADRPDGRGRGGEALMAMTSTEASFKRSVVTESQLQQGSPTPTSPETEDYLWARGVRRVVCGHKPCGDSPFVVSPSSRRGVRIEYVNCDTTYSDLAAPDSRGKAVAAVEIETVDGAHDLSLVRLRGTLVSGGTFDFRLPPLTAHERGEANGKVERAALLRPAALGDIDAAVGQELHEEAGGGRWVKARLGGNEGYHVALLRPGDRVVRYETLSAETVMAGLDSV